MRLNTSTQTLFALSSLFCFGSSLPFFSRKSPALEPLMRRATYSVVPVDGGPATNAGQPAATIVQTIVRTQAPVTVVETDKVTLPPVTNVIISTQIVEGPKTTQTILVTVTQNSVATTTATKYSVVDVSSPPVTVIIPAPEALSTSSSTSELASISSQSPSPSSAAATSTSSISPASVSTSSTFSLEPSSLKPSSSENTPTTWTTSALSSLDTISISSTQISTLSPPNAISTSMSSLLTPYPISASSTPTSTPTWLNTLSTPISSLTSAYSTFSTLYTETTTSSSSTLTPTSTPAYDNGQWHTYYPSWSNATGSRTAPDSTQTLSPKILESNPESTIETRGIFEALKQLFS